MVREAWPRGARNPDEPQKDESPVTTPNYRVVGRECACSIIQFKKEAAKGDLFYSFVVVCLSLFLKNYKSLFKDKTLGKNKWVHITCY